MSENEQNMIFYFVITIFNSYLKLKMLNFFNKIAKQ
jgi:hypothetical protein